MIAVIADDFTGAAEMAGLGLRFGLNVEINSNGIKASDADLLIVATDTRSMSSAEAYYEVNRITKELIKTGVSWIYKKTDSVLRGHVLLELKAMLDASGRQKVLLAPANPNMGRIIKNGVYYINEEPIDQTEFSDDPEYPVRTSDVLELLGTVEGISRTILKRRDTLFPVGISIAEAAAISDLDNLAAVVSRDIIPAGASDFLTSLLKSSGFTEQVKRNISKISFGKNSLFICGSASHYGKFSVGEAGLKGAEMCQMPDEVFYQKQFSEILFNNWVNETVKAFENTSRVIVEINQPVVKDRQFVKRLRNETARFVEAVMDLVEIDELFVGGGATSYSIAKRLKFDKLQPQQEIAPGVIRMKVQNQPDLHMTIKPGSYPWPEEIWRLD